MEYTLQHKNVTGGGRGLFPTPAQLSKQQTVKDSYCLKWKTLGVLLKFLYFFSRRTFIVEQAEKSCRELAKTACKT